MPAGTCQPGLTIVRTTQRSRVIAGRFLSPATEILSTMGFVYSLVQPAAAQFCRSGYARYLPSGRWKQREDKLMLQATCIDEFDGTFVKARI